MPSLSQYCLETRDRTIERAFADKETNNLDEEEWLLKRSTADWLRDAPLYIWPSESLRPFFEFWSEPENMARFVNECMVDDGVPKVREDLIENSFHYFPGIGWHGVDSVPPVFRDLESEKAYVPMTDCIAVATGQCRGERIISILFSTIFLRPSSLTDCATLAERQKLLHLLHRTPSEKIKYLPCMGHVAYAGMLRPNHGGWPPPEELGQWLIACYQLLLFTKLRAVELKRERVERKISSAGKAGYDEVIRVVAAGDSVVR